MKILKKGKSVIIVECDICTAELLINDIEDLIYKKATQDVNGEEAVHFVCPCCCLNQQIKINCIPRDMMDAIRATYHK